MINQIFTQLDLMKEYTSRPISMSFSTINSLGTLNVSWMGKPLIFVNDKYVAFDECPYCGENDLNDDNVCNRCGVPLWWWV
jgi:hypothetical protein